MVDPDKTESDASRGEPREDASLKGLLSHATAHSPFYRGMGLDGPLLERFPIIDRGILKAKLEAILTAKDAVRDRLLARLASSTSAVEQGRSEFQASDRIVIEQTSGSSGVPLRMPKTIAERTQLSIHAWRWRKHFDAGVTAANFLPLFHRHLDEPLPVSPFASTAKGVTEFYSWISPRKIRWLHAPPNLIAYHAKILRATDNVRLAGSIAFLELSGYAATEEDMAAIREVFKADIINQYGTRESWAIGYARALDPFIINERAVHVELVDEKGKRIEQPDQDGDVLITSKVLRLLPLIRYRTGDRGRWVSGGAVPGTNLRLRLSPDRDINMLVFGGRRVSGNTLFKEVFHRIDHEIGYGYAEYIQVRKTAAFQWKLLLYRCDRAEQVLAALQRYLAVHDKRNQLALKILSETEKQKIANEKPYFFVNECTEGDR